MKKNEQRRVALGAVRSQMRRVGINPKTASSDSAYAVMDDLARSEPNLIASIWYLDASDNQVKLFIREWNKNGAL